MQLFRRPHFSGLLRSLKPKRLEFALGVAYVKLDFLGLSIQPNSKLGLSRQVLDADQIPNELVGWFVD
jgi:hypothetical protein